MAFTSSIKRLAQREMSLLTMLRPLGSPLKTAAQLIRMNKKENGKRNNGKQRLKPEGLRLRSKLKFKPRSMKKTELSKKKERSEEHTSELQSQSNLVCR